jgi:probable 2-oxoglutarate dehydrogenase E1 component DHKTD1
MAFGSLVREGYNIRLCGQDVERGTFSQRHHVLTDQKTGAMFEPLNAPTVREANFGRFQTVNSHLSEEAVLGFEYGYSWESAKNFNIWEAQFGDFNNGAQILIDTFLASGESKWLRSSALTMLLPHGYDGAGPEHSSSRMERFLQMVDDSHDFPPVVGAVNGGGAPKTNNVNMLVANVTTPANYFHLLRRQMLRPYRKPLVVITPKTLLRHADAVSALGDMGEGTRFQPVLSDAGVDAKQVKTIVFVTGKVYYELVSKRAELKRTDLVFIRLEELCPFPAEALRTEVSKYSNAKQVVWFQEEPSNMGAWSYVAPRLTQALSSTKAPKHVQYVGRAALPSPAVGAGVYHKKEVEALFKAIFAV